MKAWFLHVLLLAAGQAIAAPVVVFDAGGTEPMTSYYEAIMPQKRHAYKAKNKYDTWQWPKEGFFLPLRTPELTPGTVTPRAVARALAKPLFVIGSDRFSRQWLVEYREQLAAMGAIGLLVQAETMQDVRAMMRLVGDLPTLPVPGSFLSREMGLRHYPVLISREGGIEQ